jgi:hypothetical protein
MQMDAEYLCGPGQGVGRVGWVCADSEKRSRDDRRTCGRAGLVRVAAWASRRARHSRSFGNYQLVTLLVVTLLMVTLLVVTLLVVTLLMVALLMVTLPAVMLLAVTLSGHS